MRVDKPMFIVRACVCVCVHTVYATTKQVLSTVTMGVDAGGFSLTFQYKP